MGEGAEGPGRAPTLDPMARLLLLTQALAPSAEVLPALGLLAHQVRTLPAEASVLVDAPECDVILVDARRELFQAKSLCRVIHATGAVAPVIVIVTEGGLAALNGEWGVDDVVLESAGPGEVEARIRLARARFAQPDDEDPTIRHGAIAIDESSYSARLSGRHLDLTYKEFELLKHLVLHPGRVFTRAQLLQEVWGYDYYDVHVRRLRAKLGTDHETLIGTVRNVGYRFVPEHDEVDEAVGAGA